MAKSVRHIEKNGFVYSQHQVGTDGGKTGLGTVDVLRPNSIDNLREMIDAGLETEEQAMRMYSKGKCHTLQAQARQAVKAKKIPESVFDEIFNSISDEDKIGKSWKQIEQTVRDIYESRFQTNQ